MRMTLNDQYYFLSLLIVLNLPELGKLIFLSKSLQLSYFL